MRAGRALLVGLGLALALLAPASARAGVALELFQEGLTARAEGDGAAAAQRFREAWEVEPDGALAPDALFYAAQAHDDLLGDFTVAVSLYETLLARYPRTRHGPRARERLSFLAGARAAGDEPLRRYGEITRRYRELGSDEALTRMNALRTEFPDFPLANRVILWIAAEQVRREEWALADESYRSVQERWPGTPEAARALKGRGDVAAAQGHWSEALALYRSIPVGTNGLDPAQTAQLVTSAEEQRTRAWIARAGAGYLTLFLGALVVRTRWREVGKVTAVAGRELSILLPPLALILVLARGEHQIIFRSLAVAAGLYGVVAAFNAFYLSTARPSRAGRWLHVPAVVLALVACLYVASYANGLHLMLEETLRTGPD